MADVKQPTNVGPFKLLKDQGDGTHAEVVSIGGSVTSTGGTVTQGSTTSGQSGVLSQGAVTTSAPTYTTAQTSPLSLTTFGGLRSYLLSSTGAGALSASLPTEATEALPVQPVPQKTTRIDFDKVVAANGVDTAQMTLLQTGSGMAVSQASGNLVITSGTTTYSETIIRSVLSWKDTFKLRYFLTLSQRIANNDTYIELVDVIGDGLAFTVTNATTIVVTVPNTTFTSANVGQSIYVGALSLASCLSQKATIASVAGNTVTLTVSGFPGSGSGTCSLFGWNYHHVYYTSNTATQTNWGTQRNGWTVGDQTVTINTTASGHLGIVAHDGAKTAYFDQNGNSGTGTDNSQRGSMTRNVPDTETQLYLQIRVVNGSSAPGSTTTATIDFVEMDNFILQQVSLAALEPASKAASVPVDLQSASAVVMQVQGNSGHSAASSGNPVRVSGTVHTSADTTLVNSDASDLFMTPAGQLVVKDFATADIDWQYAAAAGGISNTTTAVTIKAAAGAGIRNYITSISIATDALTNASEFVIRDGAAGTVIWRTKLGTGAENTFNVVFPTPLRGTAATLMEVATLTASGAGAVFFNAQGYSAA
jgi:hypothetical protein